MCMGWRKYSIIWFDNPELINFLWTQDRKQIEEIFELFQKTDFPNFLLMVNNDEKYYDCIDQQQWWLDTSIQEETYQYVFDKEDKCNFTNSIIKNHSQLLWIENYYQRAETMDAIIQEILITVHIFSDFYNEKFATILLKYIPYIINTTIDDLRKNHTLNSDINEFGEELTTMSYYFDEIWNSLDQIVSEINDDKQQEDNILREDNNAILLEVIYRRREFYCKKRDELEKYYDVCVRQYTIILQSVVVHWYWYLPGLCQKLRDLISIKGALDVIADWIWWY